MSLENKLADLNSKLALAQEALKLAESEAIAKLNLANKNANEEQRKKIQNVTMNAKIILNKAKNGENVDAEIRAISSQFKQKQ